MDEDLFSNFAQNYCLLGTKKENTVIRALFRFSLVFLLLQPYACREKTPHADVFPDPELPVWYYWKTTLQLSARERTLIDSMQCRHLYIKIQDVGGNAETLAQLSIPDTAHLSGLHLEPVIFIANKSFKNRSPDALAQLAQAHAVAFKSYSAQWPQYFGTTLARVQIDCDWTPSTQKAFFQYLKILKIHLPETTKLGVTLRLHQYRDPENTGIPPADFAVLMAYNTGNISAWEEDNSILKISDLRAYLHQRGAYPLPLRWALPLFEWTLVYREGELWKIIPQTTSAHWKDTAKFRPIEVMGPGSCRRFEVISGTFVAGHYLRPGDLLRCEQVDTETLQQAADLLRAQSDLKPFAPCFFTLDSNTATQNSAQMLESL